MKRIVEGIEFDDNLTPDRKLERLWQAALICGVKDALDIGINARVRERTRIIANARGWIASKDFGHVCDLAGFEPAEVRNSMREKISRVDSREAA